MELIHPDQVSLSGIHFVAPVSIREIFSVDRGKSVLRIPLDERRAEIETLPWVAQATVRRALPNKIEIDIVERTPVAFVRESSELALVDAHGVILDRPIEGDFHFPVVTGIDTAMPLADREARMQLFSGFTQQIESAHAGAMEQVSEVDLSAEHDVRATLTGLDGGETSGPAFPDAPVLVHFGDNDFAAKYQILLEEFSQWRGKAGRIESVDLRFSREAVVNQDIVASAQERPSVAPPSRATRHAATAARPKGTSRRALRVGQGALD
jgi:cell division protein FtsQ